VEIQMYSFLKLRMIVRLVKTRDFCDFMMKETLYPLHTKLGESMARPYSYGEEKHFLPLTVFISQTVPPAQTSGRIKDEFEICGWKQTVCNRALEQHQRAKNAWTTEYINRSLAELLINLGKSDTQEGNTDRKKSTMSVHICLTVVSFKPTANNTK